MNQIEKFITPFFSLFAYMAGKMFVGNEQAQLTRMKQDKPAFYLICIIGDMVVRLVCIALVLILVFALALKIVS